MSELEISLRFNPARDRMPEALRTLVSDAEEAQFHRHVHQDCSVRKIALAFAESAKGHPALQNAIMHCAAELREATDNYPQHAAVTVTFNRPDNDKYLGHIRFCLNHLPENQVGIELTKAEIDDGMQDKGISAALMKGLRKFMRDSKPLSNGALELHARDVGTYTWLNYGAVPSQESWNALRQSIQRNLYYDKTREKLHITTQLTPDNGYGLGLHPEVASCSMSQQEFNALQKVLKSRDPNKAAVLAEMRQEVTPNTATTEALGNTVCLYPDTLGKALLYDRGWAGKIDFSKPHVAEKFDNYIVTLEERQRSQG